MAEFDPRQLDQLEDALERIDDRSELESLELPDELSERLGEYQDVLALCRDAFPIEEPSDALLSEVIAEAHEVTRRRPAAEPGAWRQFWDRWRGTLIPGVALAGTAALLLLWLEPDAQIAASLPSDRDDERSQIETDEQPEPASEPSLDPQPEAPELDADTKAETDALEPERAGGGGGSVEPSSEHERPHKRKKSAAVEPPPEPKPDPLSKDDTWSLLEQADAARRKGKCGDARGHYEAIIEASADTYAIAQARAGIGLCLEQQQRDDEAEAWFDKARATSPGVDSWIDRERDEQPLPGEFSNKGKAKQAAPKKKSKKSSL